MLQISECHITQTINNISLRLSPSSGPMAGHTTKSLIGLTITISLHGEESNLSLQVSTVLLKEKD